MLTSTGKSPAQYDLPGAFLQFGAFSIKGAQPEMSTMNRQQLQEISKKRVQEAKLLLDGRHFDGCYYLLGIGVECAIKSAIAKQVNKHDFPDKSLAIDSYSHNLTQLMKTAGLWQQFEAEMRVAPALSLNWAVVKDWSVDRRYELGVSESVARDFYSACTARTHGVLSWLMKSW